MPSFIHALTHSLSINSLMHSFTLQMLSRPPLNRTDEEPEEGCCRPWGAQVPKPRIWERFQGGLAQVWTEGFLEPHSHHHGLISGTLCLERSPRACPWWLPVPRPRPCSLLPVSMSPPI